VQIGFVVLITVLVKIAKMLRRKAAALLKKPRSKITSDQITGARHCQHAPRLKMQAVCGSVFVRPCVTTQG
jgi:hypothetical protein